jgi:four helix bundle protein
MVRHVEELLVYQKALTAAYEISDLLRRPEFQRDRELSSQINRASVRVASDIAEGFEVRSDRHFAKYLYDAKGGTREMRTHLAIALARHLLTPDELTRLTETYSEIARLLGGLIKRLESDDWGRRRT